ncbi:phosphate signaling complex protein PhoU [Streptococcus caprae]|uniref:Phosphate-specific transport system accessory protein PhoU n=1 Tax=Streptococcus caprae TaxID=1640501 RepID=A0ABV8CZ38_9STRE
MLRSQFEEELDKLHNQFYAMGTAVLAQINNTTRAFVSHDRELAEEVIEKDEIINDYEMKLEKKSLEIIALQQPVSSDLRRVVTVLKASADVERMGDHAVSIAKATIRTKGEERIPEVEAEIKVLGKAVKKMVEEALDAYINKDDEKAREIAMLPDEISKHADQIQDLAVERIKNDPETIVTGKEYFRVLLYLSRIAAYATNLCEWVVYLKTGKIIEL